MLTYITREKLDDREAAAIDWAETQDGVGGFLCRYTPAIGRDPHSAETPGAPLFYQFEGRTLMRGELMRLHDSRPQIETLEEVEGLPSWMWVILGALGIVALVLVILNQLQVI